MSDSNFSRRLELLKTLLGSEILPGATELASTAGISYNRATEMLLAVAFSTGSVNLVAKAADFKAFKQLRKSGTVNSAYSRKRASQLKNVLELLKAFELTQTKKEEKSETAKEDDEQRKQSRDLGDNHLYFDFQDERFERIRDVTDELLESVNDVKEKRRKKPKAFRSTVRAAGLLETDFHAVATSIAREHHQQFDRMSFDSYDDSDSRGLPTPWTELEKSTPRIYRIPDVVDTAIVGDIHFPYYSRRALELFIDELDRREIRRLLVLGDLTDMYALSKYPKKRRLQHFKPELEASRQGIGAFGEALKSRDIESFVFLGNHDLRFMLFLFGSAPELVDIDALSYSSLLRLEKSGFKVIDSESVFAETGGIIMAHGDKVRLSYGKTLGEKIFRTYNKTALHAHSHQVSTFLADRTGRSCVGGYSIGCMSSLEVDYNLTNPYMHGACFLKAADHGTDLKYRIENCVLYDGKFCPQFSF